MSLVVEDGTGLASAESYCSVEYADAWHVKMGTPAAEWTDLTTTQKEVALRLATIDIESRRMIGEKKTLAQALHWPAVEAYIDDFELPTTSVPTAIANACAELARHAHAAKLLIAEQGAAAVSSESVSVGGTISESKSYIGGKTSEWNFPLVNSLLRKYVSYGGRLARS